MPLLRQFRRGIAAVIFCALSGQLAHAAENPATSAAQNVGTLVQTIPYETLIKQAVGDLKATAPLLQARPSPLAPVNPELLAAWKELEPLQPGTTRYPAARRKYLDALEQYGDPTGLLPTLPDATNDDRPKVLQQPLTVDGLFDAETLIVESQEAGKAIDGPLAGMESREIVRRLWVASRNVAKPILSTGDAVTLKAKQPGQPASSGTLNAFRMVKIGRTSGRLLLAIKIKGMQPALERRESYATWDSNNGLRVIVVPNERIPEFTDDWYPTELETASISGDGAVALLVKAIRQSDAKQSRRFVLVASPDGVVQLGAGILDTKPGTRETSVQLGKQNTSVEGANGQVDVEIGQWNRDGSLQIIVHHVTGNLASHADWNYSIRDGTAKLVKDEPYGQSLPKLAFETTQVSRPSASNPQWTVNVTVPILVVKNGTRSTTIAQFPLPPLEGFAQDQTLDAQAPRQKSDPPAVAGPDGRVAFTAYVDGKTPVKFDPDQGRNVTSGNHSKQWVLLETTLGGEKPHLVAQGDTPIPAPDFAGIHYLGSIPQMAYLPDGRLLFGGADDAKQVVAGMAPASPNAAVGSLWIWDGKQITKLADRFTAVEVPAGSRRVLDQFTYEMQPGLNVVLLHRSADGCAFTISLPQK